MEQGLAHDAVFNAYILFQHYLTQSNRPHTIPAEIECADDLLCSTNPKNLKPHLVARMCSDLVQTPLETMINLVARALNANPEQNAAIITTHLRDHPIIMAKILKAQATEHLLTLEDTKNSLGWRHVAIGACIFAATFGLYHLGQKKPQPIGSRSSPTATQPQPERTMPTQPKLSAAALRA